MTIESDSLVFSKKKRPICGTFSGISLGAPFFSAHKQQPGDEKVPDVIAAPSPEGEGAPDAPAVSPPIELLPFVRRGVSWGWKSDARAPGLLRRLRLGLHHLLAIELGV